MDEEKFNLLVAEALDDLPEKFQSRLNNLAILVEDFPTPEQLRKVGLKDKYMLFGLFEGYVQSSRINIGPVLPDRITIFRQPILRVCNSGENCRSKIFSTVKHEIAHHFGSDEKGARKAGRCKT